MKEIIIKRLSFIKYLYNFAIEHSYKPEPLNAVSLLIFHDALDLFTQIAIEKVDHLVIDNYVKNTHKKRDKLYLIDYLEILGINSQAMMRINTARNSLKHVGNLPNKIDIESFRASITAFFEENILKIFEIEFSEISLIDIISNEKAKGSLKAAEALLKEHKLEESLAETAIAFNVLVREYGSPKINKESLNINSAKELGIESLKDSHKLLNYIKKLKNAIESTHNDLRYISLGIDYQKYLRFRHLTPHISWTLNGNYTYYGGWWRPGSLPSMGDVESCINFVIESAVILQQSKEI
jgi:hypothetical protein